MEGYLQQKDPWPWVNGLREEMNSYSNEQLKERRESSLSQISEGKWQFSFDNFYHKGPVFSRNFEEIYAKMQEELYKDLWAFINKTSFREKIVSYEKDYYGL